MNLEIQHIEVHVSSLEKARDFYVRQLGLKVIEETPALNLFSVRAGSVRISIFAGYETQTEKREKQTGTHIIFRTQDISKTIAELKERGVVFKGEIFEAPGFIKGITTEDPDGNIIEVAEYLRDPLKGIN